MAGDPRRQHRIVVELVPRRGGSWKNGMANPTAVTLRREPATRRGGEVAENTVVIEIVVPSTLRGVLGAAVGCSRVRAGIIGGGVGTADVLADDGARFTLRLAITDPAPAPLPIELVLAVPRPRR